MEIGVELMIKLIRKRQRLVESGVWHFSTAKVKLSAQRWEWKKLEVSPTSTPTPPSPWDASLNICCRTLECLRVYGKLRVTAFHPNPRSELQLNSSGLSKLNSEIPVTPYSTPISVVYALFLCHPFVSLWIEIRCYKHRE